MPQRNQVFFFMSAVLQIQAILSAGVESNFTTVLSMDDFVKIQCTVERPFKCAPDGACCNGSEFCRDGLCEKCFPLRVQNDGLLAWCRSTGQYNTSAMRSPMCRLACQDLFNSTELASVDGCQNEARSGSGDTDQSQPNVTNADSDNVRRNTAASGDDSSSGLDTVKALCGTILVLVLIVIALVLYVVIGKKKSASSGGSQHEDGSGSRDTDQSQPNARSEFECCQVIGDAASRLKKFVCCTKGAEDPPEPPRGGTQELPTINGETGAPRSTNSPSTTSSEPPPSVEDVNAAHGGVQAGAASSLQEHEALDDKLSVAIPQGQSKSQSPADSAVPMPEQAINVLISRSVDSHTGPSASAPDSDQEMENDESDPCLPVNPGLDASVGMKEKALRQLKRENPLNY